MKTVEWTDIAETMTRRFSPVMGSETVSLKGCIGRILARPLEASQSLPAMTHAVMDGYALGSNPPGLYHIKASGIETLAIDEASPVAAGGPIPAGTSGVVLADHAEVVDGRLHVSHSLAKNNIRRAGEEAQKGDVLLTEGTCLDARHIALATASGAASFTVRKRPRVALLGLHEQEQAFVHVALMHALLDSPALQLTHAGSVRSEWLCQTLERLSVSHDLIVVVAESLGAEGGILAQAIERLGGQHSVSRASLKPAKPLIFGQLQPTQIIGLAGTAYATTVAAHLFLRPALQRLLGLPLAHDLLPVQAGFERSRMPGRTEALPARISVTGKHLIMNPAGRFGQLRALAAMDGFALVPAEAETITSGLSMLFRKLSFPLI